MGKRLIETQMWWLIIRDGSGMRERGRESKQNERIRTIK